MFQRLRNYISSDPPNKVIQVDISTYNNKEYFIHRRNATNDVLLYGVGKDENKFEIILQRPCNETTTAAYSLLRCDSFEVTELKFLSFGEKIPPLFSISKDTSIALLQRLCDAITAHQSWNIAHLAVELNMLDCLNNPGVIEDMFIAEPFEGITPLMLAVRNQNVKAIQILLNHNVPVDVCDNLETSVLHHAANTNKKIINMICQVSKETLNSKTAKDMTPLHIACINDNRECVSALLEAGADVNISADATNRPHEPGCVGDSIQRFPKKLHEDDIKFGGTPLHWADSREVIEELVNKKCDINGINFDRRSALHMMVLRGSFDCAVTLLCYGADTSLCDKDGKSALRMAIDKPDLMLVKALIVFNANINERDDKNNTLRHAIICGLSPYDEIIYVLNSVGVPRCDPTVRGCTPGCAAFECFNGLPPPSILTSPSRDTLDLLLEDATPQRSNFKKGRLLSLDGGGIRGIIIIIVLMELEKAVGKPILHCFDWVTGTSTGGILALAIASGKSLDECLSLYFQMKDSVFVGITRPYSSEPLDNILKKTFGDCTMSDIQNPRLTITATLTDRQPVDLHLFRNYPSPSDILQVPHEGPWAEPQPAPMQLLWEAARATGAAPSYFSAMGKYVDGGLISNNPTLDAMTEIHEYNVSMKAVGRHNEATPLSLVVSIGTGIIPRTHTEDGLDIVPIEGIWQLAKAITVVPSFLKVLIDQATQADGRVVDRARAWCSTLGVPFFRFSPQISEEIAMNEVKNEKLVNMMWETRLYMHKKLKDSDQLIQILREPTEQ